MTDFQAIHARQLEIYGEYQRTRERILEPVRRSRTKIEGQKKTLLAVARATASRSSLLPRDLIGQRVNLFV
ncbi:MAG: hypothetical protein V1794_13260 [Candidatus Glassbacteria bacterium]